MRTFLSCFARRQARLMTLLALGSAFAAVALPARADDVPSLRRGLWEYQKTAGANRYAATECIDPSEDLRRQQAALEKMGCTLSPTLHNGSSYTYSAECSVKLPSGAVTFTTVSVLTAESDSAYRLENRMTNKGSTTNESITAQRVADCAN
jgi:uncharacterized protein DUF3617